MVDPVLCNERGAIKQRLDAGNLSSPVTGAPLGSRELTPNFALKSLLAAVAQHGT